MNAFKKSSPRPLLRLALPALLCALAGCNIIPQAQEDATRYFVLSYASAGTGSVPAAGGVRLGLKYVRLEGYLKRREMIVRTGPNEVDFRDFRRWAEPLDAAIANALRSRLLASSAVGQVSLEPFPPDQDRDYDVSVVVSRCEGAVSSSGKYVANLVATIDVSTTGVDAHVVARKTFVAPAASWDGVDFDQLASLISADVAALGQAILSEIPAKG